MKTSDRLVLLALVLAAICARCFELLRSPFTDGMPSYSLLVLVLTGASFLITVRRLPARETVSADFAGLFRFDSQLALTAGIAGAFLLLVGAALRVLFFGGGSVNVLLALFLALSGAAMLYVLVSLRRGGSFLPPALLVPVCCLVVQLILTYRENARDSMLVHFYVRILALAALCLAALYLAAFAYRCGSPRTFAAAAHTAVVLTAATCVDLLLMQRLDLLAAALGALLLLAAFLEAAGDFEG